MSGAIKATTGLTGLAVSKHPHYTLTTLYNKILKALAVLPEDAAYRRHTEKLVNQRLDLVKKEPDVGKLELAINSGQVEELIVQAEKELELARKMIQFKPWEPLVEQPPERQWKWPV